MITAFVGGLYALMEHNIQRLLAYHTSENIGIILLGLGAGVTGIALEQPALIALGRSVVCTICLTIACSKAYCSSGGERLVPYRSSRYRKTRWYWQENAGYLHRHVSRVDGNGCAAAAERFCRGMGYLSILFKLSNSGAFVARLLGPLLAVGLAITGALAVMCMAKVYGVTFLGAPRTKEAENATCAPLLMSVSVVALAICCVIGGVAAPWLLPMLSAAVPLPLEPANTTVSQPMITLLLIACPLLPFIIMAICKGDRLPSRSRGAARVCGYDHEKSMVITAHGFAMPVKQAFAPVLKLRKWLNPVSLVPGWQCEGSALLFRRMALVELAVLVVIIVSRGA